MSSEHIAPDSSVNDAVSIPRLDKDGAFKIFSKDSRYISKENLPLFLKSIGLSGLKIEDNLKKHNEVTLIQLKEAIDYVLSDPVINKSCDEAREWPSEVDVIEAFKVFDQEGYGFIPVQQLKRFLLQSQLGFQEEELEKLIRENCKIDNDNQINYGEFVMNIKERFMSLSD